VSRPCVPGVGGVLEQVETDHGAATGHGRGRSRQTRCWGSEESAVGLGLQQDPSRPYLVQLGAVIGVVWGCCLRSG
jgi:hypothetical protein